LESNLGSDEGTGEIGLERGCGWLARVAIQAAGKIHRQSTGWPAIHPLDGRTVWFSGCTLSPGAEQGVDQPGWIMHMFFQRGLKIFAGPEIDQGYVRMRKDFEVETRIAAEFLRWGKQQHLNWNLTNFQMPRNDKSVTRIIPFATKDAYFAKMGAGCLRVLWSKGWIYL
jgi:hypothetical protein